MKRRLVTIVFFLVTLSIYGQSRGSVSLDVAISNSAWQIQEDIGKGSTIIVYQFQSPNEQLSVYVMKELFNLLVNSRKFIMLDRTAQKVIDAELDFQFNRSAGMISDNSLASLTQRIGGQASITGSLDDIGTEYRFYIKAVGIETTATPFSYAVSISKNDQRIRSFLGRTTGDKIGTGALNILFGLGSYLERDISGGITLTAGYAVAAGLMAIEAAVLDWDSSAVGVPATIGVTVAGITLVYGFIRPFIYKRSPRMAVIMDKNRTRIVLTSNKSGGNPNYGFQLTYTFKF